MVGSALPRYFELIVAYCLMIIGEFARGGCGFLKMNRRNGWACEFIHNGYLFPDRQKQPLSQLKQRY